ncbi:YbaB/EbfC family nucleoid-associated protein [Sulfuricurvum sp. IAE1]|uniref:YbaB/EbfC family nucleoid-associated protein n=1 Tax=Sulfuricurvum sp. IAE1 TaxID=2546102 RepID=UPI001048A40B|nr:YbaB/EbfC family nucleoid-associated protein [Sulfuricurvum sp. IAE1]TDA62532.1 YbaB/EbfC family nucleoid-associated protein [Sulfuricurvum sp. IAE1]
MFGNLSEMGKMFEALQSQAKAMDEELSERRYTIKSGGGMVKLTLNGKGEALDLEIDDSLLEDKSSLQIILLSTISDAYKMVEDNKKQHALGMLGGMNPFTK